MTPRDPFWDDLAAHKKNKFDSDRVQFLSDAIDADDGNWTKHTPYHWSRMINGERLDYWPSRKKFQWRGRVMRGLSAMRTVINAATE